MSTLLIMIVLALIIGAILLRKLLSGVFKVLSVVFLFLLIFGTVFSFMVLQDVRSFTNAIQNEESVYVLTVEEEYFVAFTMQGVNQSTFSPFPLDEIDDLIEDDNNSRLIFLVNESVIEVEEPTTITDQAYGFLYDGDYETQANGFVFLYLYQFQESGPFFMVDGIATGQIDVVPSSLLVTIFRKAPRALFIEAKNRVAREVGDVDIDKLVE